MSEDQTITKNISVLLREILYFLPVFLIIFFLLSPIFSWALGAPFYRDIQLMATNEFFGEQLNLSPTNFLKL